MKQQEKKKNYYRLSLLGGRMYRTRLTEDYRLTGEGGGSFFYLAPVFDTAEQEETFHRFCLKGEWKQCKLEVIVAATDRDLSDILENGNITLDEITQVLKECSYQRKVNNTDFLLHNLTGRYLWILIVISASQTDSSFTIDGFEVEFPQSSFVEYLPEIYQGEADSFFNRYMAALQSLYVDLEKEVGKIPGYLDYEQTDDDKLKILSEWVGINGENIAYTPTQLRQILAQLSAIQTGKGTGEILKKILALLTGKQAILVEYFKWNDWMMYSSQEQQYEALYGASKTSFSCILNYVAEEAQDIPNPDEIMKVIEHFMPFGLTCNLVFLRENYNMDTHCYLDVNSYLSTPESADTSGFVLGGNYVLG